MNVGFEDLSTKDVASMLKVDQHTVSDWCKRGQIRNTNLSGGGQKGRYMIPEDEAEYLRKLFKKWGKTKAMRHYDVTRIEPVLVTSGVVGNYGDQPVVPEEIAVEPIADKIPVRQEFDLDDIMTTVSYLHDIRERMEDIMAEYNQLQNEYNQLKEEVVNKF